MSTDTNTFKVVVVNAGTSDPSSTQMLAGRIADSVAAMGKTRGAAVTLSVINLRELAQEITSAMVSGLQGPKLEHAVEVLGQADGIIAATPVYKAEASGLFSSFFHVLDNDLLIGKPVILAATAGSVRHALVADHQMRALFAYLRTLVMPTAIFAASEDWNSSALGDRTDRAALELLLIMESGFSRNVRDESWNAYQHEFGSAGGTELSVDLETDLMKLATGGRA